MTISCLWATGYFSSVRQKHLSHELGSEWAQRSARAKRVVLSKQMSERRERMSGWPSTLSVDLQSFYPLWVAALFVTAAGSDTLFFIRTWFVIFRIEKVMKYNLYIYMSFKFILIMFLELNISFCFSLCFMSFQRIWLQNKIWLSCSILLYIRVV